jgi:hypothetical protein
MSFRWYRTHIDAGYVEILVHGMALEGRNAIAVEVFDHPDARPDKFQGTTIGPWIIGEPDDVYAELRSHGHTDYAEQYAEDGSQVVTDV